MRIKSKHIVSLIVLILLIIVLGSLMATHFLKSKKPQETQIAVSATPAAIITLPLQASALGTLVALEATQIKANAAGNITAINVQNGQEVSARQLIMQIDDSTQQAALAKAKAAFLQAKNKLNSYARLIKIQPDAVSAIDYDAVVANYQEAKAALQTAKVNLAYTHVIAPFSGTLGATTLSVGSYVNVGDKLINIVNRNSLEVQYVLPQTYYALVHLGQTVSLTSSALSNTTVSGVVDFIAPDINDTSNAFLVRAKVANTNNLLAPGMLMQVTQMLDPNRKVLAVPSIAIIPDMSGYGVYVVQNGHANEVFIKIGSQYNNWVEVTSGLKVGDLVITLGQQNVEPGSLVTLSSHS